MTKTSTGLPFEEYSQRCRGQGMSAGTALQAGPVADVAWGCRKLTTSVPEEKVYKEKLRSRWRRRDGDDDMAMHTQQCTVAGSAEPGPAGSWSVPTAASSTPSRPYHVVNPNFDPNSTSRY